MGYENELHMLKAFFCFFIFHVFLEGVLISKFLWIYKHKTQKSEIKIYVYILGPAKRTADTVITLYCKHCRNQGKFKVKTKVYQPGNGLVRVLFTE